MIILPIGTKSTLALKPKITIALIAVNIVIALFTVPLMMSTEGNLIKVQRMRIAAQLRLYVEEHKGRSVLDTSLESYVDGYIDDIERAEDYIDLEHAVMKATSFANISWEELNEFERELHERTDDHYENPFSRPAVLFADWKRFQDKETKVLEANVNFSFGLVPSRTTRIHTFITYMFLHGGIWHLIGNLIFLWVVGCLLEDTWGRLPFLVFYLAGGALAGLAHCLQDMTSTVPLIGASGAIAAAMGAFTVRHFWTKIKFFYFFIFFFRPFWGNFHLPACVFLPFWFLQQVMLKSLADFTGGSDVAYIAHIAGYLMGVTTALAFKATGFEANYLRTKVEQKQVSEGVLQDPRFDEACTFLSTGKIEQAKTLFQQVIRAHPGNLNTIQDIAFLYRENGLMTEYAKLTDYALKNLLLKSRFEDAACLAIEIIKSGDEDHVNGQSLMRVGKWFAEQDRRGETHDMYRAVIRSSANAQMKAKASIALARLLNGKMNNPRDAVLVLDVAAGLDLDSEWLDRIKEMRSTIESMSPAGTTV